CTEEAWIIADGLHGLLPCIQKHRPPGLIFIYLQQEIALSLLTFMHSEHKKHWQQLWPRM
ncbi:MAG: hypothetical protein AAGJ35_14590, partial [Myxococcota bacterium]